MNFVVHFYLNIQEEYTRKATFFVCLQCFLLVSTLAFWTGLCFALEDTEHPWTSLT